MNGACDRKDLHFGYIAQNSWKGLGPETVNCAVVLRQVCGGCVVADRLAKSEFDLGCLQINGCNFERPPYQNSPSLTARMKKTNAQMMSRKSVFNQIFCYFQSVSAC
jgi:hypothetical protein